MKKKIMSFLLAASMCAGLMPAASAANENWRDPFVTRIMKVISQDPSYTDVVLTDLDRNGIPEAFVIKKGAYGRIGAGFTMVNNVITDIETPTNIIGECLENINVYIKNDRYIFVGEEVPRYVSQIMYYKLTLEDGRLIATRINKKDVSPYANVTYEDKYSNNLLENGYPNRGKIAGFIASYDAVNNISAKLAITNMRVNGEDVSISGYSVSDSSYYKVRDIAMLLRSTSKKFNVTWDNELGAIQIRTGEDYQVVGGEMTRETAENIQVVENSTPTYVDGRQRAITTYNINGSSYYKIRDIADAVGFDVQWDGETQTINITTD